MINNTGVIEANTIGTRNGMIVLSAATAASKPAGAPTQTVKIGGTLSAAGNKTGETGGKIQITGELIALTGAHIDASGAAGGGTVLIGGDTGGGHPSSAVAAITRRNCNPMRSHASNVTVDAATTINASATGQRQRRHGRGVVGRINVVQWIDFGARRSERRQRRVCRDLGPHARLYRRARGHVGSKRTDRIVAA